MPGSTRSNEYEGADVSPISRSSTISSVRKKWPEKNAAGRRSTESLQPILAELPEYDYPRNMSHFSVGSGIESVRPGVHNRRSSGESSLIVVRSSRSISQSPAQGGLVEASPADVSGADAINSKTIIPPPNKMAFRLSAIIPFLLSAAAFSLSLVLVLAGTKGGMMTDVHIISFNMTNLGTGIVNFAPASSAAATASATGGLGKRTASAEITSVSATVTTSIVERRAFNPLDPLGLAPALSSAVVSRVSVDSSVLSSAGSRLTSAFPLPSLSLPGLPSPTGLLSGGNSNGSLLGEVGNIISDGFQTILSGLVTGLGLTNITAEIDDELNKAVTGGISRVISRAGVEEYYSIHILSTCKGSSPANLSSCSAFASTANSISNITSKVPTNLAVAGTNVSSPALDELMDATASLGPLITSLTKLFLAFMILSLINSGLSIIFSFLGIFFPYNRPILYFNVSLVSLGTITRITDAILATTISAGLTTLTNKFGSTLGVTAKEGGVFIAFIWVGFVVQLGAGVYWLVVWFVEFRQISFRVRKREKDEIGNYRGIGQELKKDIRQPKRPKEKEKQFTVV